MPSLKKSLYLSERMQAVVGPALEHSGKSLTRRVNTISDRYGFALESVGVDELLTEEELAQVGDALAGPWHRPAAEVVDLPGRVADSLGLEVDEDTGRLMGFGESVELVRKLAGLTPLQLLAVVESVERRFFPDLNDDAAEAHEQMRPRTL